jgi:hypothetical protein
MSPSGGLTVAEITNPAATGSRSPFLSATGNGSIVLSWLEPSGNGQLALRFARRSGNTWSSPKTIAASPFFNRHPAVLPSVRLLPNGSYVSYWTHRAERAPSSEEVYSSLSSDGGDTWSKAVILHRDSSLSEHSLVSMAEFGNEVSIVWLDERNGEKSGKTALMQRSWKPDGTLGPEIMLDDDVCSCCPTTSAPIAGGILIAYRNHTQDNIRDIYLVRQSKSGWSKPYPLHADNWHINGCPTNAADLATDGGQRAAILWYTGAGDQPHVKIAFSSDAGATFAEPIVVDQGHPAGHASVALLPDGSAIASWLERTTSSADLVVRRINAKGQLGPVTVVATGSTSELGYPRIVDAGTGAIVAWAGRGSGHGVHTAFIAGNHL